MARSVVVGGVLVSVSLMLAAVLNSNASREAARIGRGGPAAQNVAAAAPPQRAVEPAASPRRDGSAFDRRNIESKPSSGTDMSSPAQDDLDHLQR